MIEVLSTIIPSRLLPKQLVDDIKESETIVINQDQERGFLLLLVIFLNDFCHVCLQYMYGIDDRLVSGGQTAEGMALLHERRGQAECVNEYIQMFCSLLEQKEISKIVKPCVLLHIMQKYIPCSLIEMEMGPQGNVPEVLDRLQDNLLCAIPELRAKSEGLRLSGLWLRFTEEAGNLIESDVVENLWVSLGRTITHSHTLPRAKSKKE